MAGLLGSWWSGKPAEEEKKSEKEEKSDEEKEKGSESKEHSWVSGLEGKADAISDQCCD